MKIMQSKGFTLIELMVTIAVLAIIAMMAVPSFTNMRLQQNLNASAQELTAKLAQARSKAILERRDVKVLLDETKKKGDTDSILYWRLKGDAILMAQSPTSVIFEISGGLKDNDGNDVVFTLCASEVAQAKSKVISVSRMGAIHQTQGTCP